MAFTMSMALFAVLVAAVGFIFQSILQSPYRIVIYPVSLVIGILLAVDFNYYLVSFNIGMIGRAASGGYWHCAVMEAAALAIGFLAAAWALA